MTIFIREFCVYTFAPSLYCVSQVIVQRALAAKNIGHARGATLMAGYLKFLPLFLIIMPGMISRVLFTGNGNVSGIRLTRIVLQREYKKEGGLNANNTSLHERQIDTEINTRLPYDPQ